MGSNHEQLGDSTRIASTGYEAAPTDDWQGPYRVLSKDDGSITEQTGAIGFDMPIILDRPPRDRLGGRADLNAILYRDGPLAFYAAILMVYREGLEFEIGCRTTSERLEGNRGSTLGSRAGDITVTVAFSGHSLTAPATTSEGVLRSLQGVSTEGSWWRRYWLSPLPEGSLNVALALPDDLGSSGSASHDFDGSIIRSASHREFSLLPDQA